jgi:nicotinate-nucleotide adenylyltransferase
MIRTCIYGGSFNPIHNGHIALAQQILDENLTDEVWFVVSPLNPFKQNEDLLSDEQRLNMTSIALEGKSGMYVSDFEFRMPRPSYMVNTLIALCLTYPEREFSLFIGADNWLSFNRWYHYEEILSHYTVYIYPRNDIKVDETLMPCNVHLLHSPLIYMSSTEIRDRLKKGKSINDIVPPKVAEIIYQNGFYK